MASDTKEEGCPSPRPMAFTVDFGDTDSEEKKLALRDSIGRFAPAKIKQKLLANIKDNTNAVKADIILDEENNIANAEAAAGDHNKHDATSDAGTYTIEDELEDKAIAEKVANRDKEIHRAFGVPDDDKMCSREWVSVWASNSFAEDNPIQELEEDLEHEGGRSSSGQRRRLPPTPLRLVNGYQNQYHEPNDEDDDSTNDYLRDTISLMTAMEARISSSAEERKEPIRPTTSSEKRRPKTASSETRRSANSAAAKAKEAKDLAAQQWQRRKNYDPLKSMAKSRAKTSRDQLQYTDESSDVESAASFSRGSGLSNPRIAMIRSDGGRHSLRQNNKCDLPQQQPQSLGHVPVRRPPFKTNVMSQNGGRSTSSLSSKEAEFQAWKRRKNYNPMKSATAAASTSPKKQHPKAAVARTTSNNCASASEEPNTSSNQMHKRSASFHYPDGTSRVTHSVYSSEEDFNDEDDDDDQQEPRLYEVNEDELFLAYDSGGVVAPRRQKRTPPSRNTNGSSSSTQSGSKLEALDNLVISTIFSVSTKLCVLSGKLVKSLQERTRDKEEEAMLQTLLYVLDDIDPPVSPSKRTSRELAGTLRNLKKVEQALQTLERSESEM